MICLSTSQNLFRNFETFFMIFFHYCFGVHIYKHWDNAQIQRILNKMKNSYSYMYDDDGYPIGFVLDKTNKIPKYIAYIQDATYNKKLTILCSPEIHEMLTRFETDKIKYDVKDIVKPSTISMVYRNGNYDYFDYRNRTIEINYTYNCEQLKLSEKN